MPRCIIKYHVVESTEDSGPSPTNERNSATSQMVEERARKVLQDLAEPGNESWKAHYVLFGKEFTDGAQSGQAKDLGEPTVGLDRLDLREAWHPSLANIGITAQQRGDEMLAIDQKYTRGLPFLGSKTHTGTR